MQIIHQSCLSYIRKGVKGALRAALLLCVLSCAPLVSVKAVTEKGAVYKGDTLLWRCLQVFDQSGSPYSDGPSYTLYFRTIDTVRYKESAALCKGDTLLWRCHQLWLPGCYVDTVRSLEFPDLDSVYYQLNLTQNVIVPVEQSITAYLGDTLLWRCKQIACKELSGATPFEYADTVNNGGICPDVYVLKLTVTALPVTEVEESVDICAGDTLLWHCMQLFDASGSPYHDTLRSLKYPAYDSIRYTLNLSVTPIVPEVQSLTAYLGDTLLWRCKQIACKDLSGDTPFEYADTVSSGGLCPDVYLLKLTVVPMPVKEEVEDIVICPGDTLLWHCQQIYDESGSPYHDTLRSIKYPAYDSIHYTLNLSFAPAAQEYNYTAEIMLHDTLLWRCMQIPGNTLSGDEPFEYRDTVSGGTPKCPTEIHILSLTVKYPEPDTIETSYTYCGHDTLLWRCQELTKSGDYTDSIMSSEYPELVDVRYIYHLTYNKDSIAPWDTIYVKPGEFPYSWYGDALPAPDEYTHWTQYENGCDSVLHRVRLVQRDTTKLTSCNGDTMLWRCTFAYETKVYEEQVEAIGSVTGEQTIKELYYLDFTFVEAPYDSIKNDTVTYSPYLWRGQSLTEDGTYRDTVYYDNDPESCIDSLFTLNLKIELAYDSIKHDTICIGDTVLWRCQQLTESGDYHDTLPYSLSGNDSIRFTMVLTVHKDSIAPWDTVYVKPGDFPYDWNGWTNCATPGEYEHQTKYAPTSYQTEGCDSILFRVRVVLRDSVSGYTCNGDTMLWRCQQAFETKVYSDIISAEGAISHESTITEMYYLDFTYHEAPYDSIKNDTVTYSPYLWRGQSLTEDGTYRDTVYYDNDPAGCIDSLFTLNLKIELAIDSITSDTICRGDIELWRCFQADTTGIYKDTLRYVESGNDSIRFELRLTVHKDSIAPLEQVILCNGDSLAWYEQETEAITRYIKEPGHYTCQTHYEPTSYQKAYGQPGCDSVFHELVLIVRPMRDTLMKDTICYDPLAPTYTWRSWHDTTFQIPTTDIESEWYTFTDTARYAGTTDCDSVRYTMKVWVRRIEGREFYTKDSVCADGGNVPQEYDWVIEDDGNRVVHVVLTAAERAKEGKFIVTRRDTVRYTPTSKGYMCDSAYYELNLYVFRPKLDPNDPNRLDTVVMDTTLCYTDAIEWYGQTYNTEGTYEHKFKYDKTDCDSLICRLQLHYYAEPDTIPLPMKLCKGAQEQTAGPHDIPISTDESRIYWDSIYYPNTQCVSHFYKIDVTVLAPTISDSSAVFCHGGQFIWDRTGEVLTDTGMYSYSIPYKVIGGDCDSLVYNLHLTEIVLDSMPVDTQYICNGQSYEWRGKTYDQTGIYRDTVQSVGGCDSMYYILNLEKQPPREYVHDSLFICGPSGEVTWNFNGKTYTKSGTYYDTIRTPQGCDLVIGELRVKTQLVTVADTDYVSIYNTQSYTWHGKDYTLPGTYRDTARYVSGCDSVLYTMVLTVMDIHYRYADDVLDTVCVGTRYTEYTKKEYVINDHTIWYDTTRTTDPDGVLVDVITKYDIDVYDTSLPQGFLKYAVASCGLAVNIDSAVLLLDDYIDNTPRYAYVENIDWKYREENGVWQDVESATALSGKVTKVEIKCEITTECGTVSDQAFINVSRHATPEAFTEYDQLPVIIKYNGTLLMIDLNTICQRFNWQDGVDIHPEDVKWYRVVGYIDNLSYPNPSDPNDIYMNKWGYYYTPENDDNYYALIEGTLQAEGDDCGVWARTLPVGGLSPVQLQPNVSQPNGVVSVTGTSDCYVSIYDMYGTETMGRTHISGTFKAPNASGTYFVTIQDASGTYHRTLIVYP